MRLDQRWVPKRKFWEGVSEGDKGRWELGGGFRRDGSGVDERWGPCGA